MIEQKRNWIFRALFIVGILFTLIFILSQTNLFYKNYDFEEYVIYDSSIDGDVGYLIIERNEKTNSVKDWVSFENNSQIRYFSDSLIKEKIYVDIPDVVESGTYYYNVKIVYLSGLIEIKEMSFKIS